MKGKLKDYPPLVKREDITFKDFELERFKIDDGNEGYWYQHNWVFIGSLGDPETWKGTSIVSKNSKGSKSGLYGTLIDMNVMQEILYQRPSGKPKYGY